MSECAHALAGGGANDTREVALIDESEIGREDGQVLVPVGQTVERHRDANSIPELRERHPGESGEDSADVEARMTERRRQVLKVGARRIRDDRLAGVLDETAVVGSGRRAVSGEPPGGGAFREGPDELCEPLVELESVDAPPEPNDEFAMPEIDGGRGRDRLVGHRGITGQCIHGAIRQPE